MHEKTTSGNAVPVNCYILYLHFNIWKHFAFMSCFYTWNLPNILGNRFFFYKFVTIYIYTSTLFAWFAWGFWIFGLTFTVSFWFWNNILFSILTRNAFHVPLLIIFGNTVFSIGITFWKNVFEGIIDRNASMVFVLFF